MPADHIDLELTTRELRAADAALSKLQRVRMARARADGYLGRRHAGDERLRSAWLAWSAWTLTCASFGEPLDQQRAILEVVLPPVLRSQLSPDGESGLHALFRAAAPDRSGELCESIMPTFATALVATDRLAFVAKRAREIVRKNLEPLPLPQICVRCKSLTLAWSRLRVEYGPLRDRAGAIVLCAPCGDALLREFMAAGIRHDAAVAPDGISDARPAGNAP
jgi:hypothetical protein